MAQVWSESKRERVLAKTNGHCWYCGRVLTMSSEGWSESMFCVDHATSKHKGGNNKIDNLLPSCFACNSGSKKGLTVEEYRERLGYDLIGAPIFSQEQREWLEINGIEIPEPAPIVFWGELQ